MALGLLAEPGRADSYPKPPLTQSDILHGRSAIYFADHEHWQDALYFTQNCDPAILTLIHWMRYRTKNSNASFEEIIRFITDHPNWPDQELLRQRAEEAITLTTPKIDILNWFDDNDPITGDGIKFYAIARASQKAKDAQEQEEINGLLRQAWVRGNFGKDEKEFLDRYGSVLRISDNLARIDQLLWQGKVSQAQALMHHADAGHQNLYLMRIRLMENRNANGMLASIPKALQNDTGLLYERLVWNARKGNTETVKSLLAQMPDNPPYPERWWEIKNNVIRELIKERDFKTAYQLASKHHPDKGEDFAEAEWLSGWLALRFLDNPRVAYNHFYSLYQGAQFSVSKARGAYWAGRASEKNGNLDIASKWYQLAANYKDTFYGQLAIMKLDRKSALNIPLMPTPTHADMQSYLHNDLVKAAILLIDNHQTDLAKKVLGSAVFNAKTPGEASLITNFGLASQRPDLSVETGKQAARKGIFISRSSYPILSTLIDNRLETPLSMAIIRQESAFDHTAQSPVGALGLMQLMPNTASSLAKELRMKFDRRQLTSQSYNAKLGNFYMQKLLSSFNGSYILAIAAYNGGQGNVHKWIKEYGDPRKATSVEEVIDWIEYIPFTETRNYIQRILANVQVYRELMRKQKQQQIMIETDLKR